MSSKKTASKKTASKKTDAAAPATPPEVEIDDQRVAALAGIPPSQLVGWRDHGEFVRVVYCTKTRTEREDFPIAPADAEGVE